LYYWVSRVTSPQSWHEERCIGGMELAISKANVKTLGDLREYIADRTQSRDRLYHYTTYESLVMILTQRCFRISHLNLLNDRAEQTLTQDAVRMDSYIMSFSHDPKEYVSMWALYGKPSGIKLRVDFPAKALIKSIDGNFYTDSDRREKISLDEICPDPVTNRGFSISDVVYYDKDKNTLSHNTRPFTNLAVDRNMVQSLAGFVKYDAWEFEKETRLRLLLHGGGSHPQYIYAGIDDPFVREIGVCYNPWISDSLRNELQISIDRLAGHALFHTLSQNHGEIKEL